MRSALLLLTGCNAVFGLESTDLVPPVDAQFFDAPAPGERMCPPIGTPPKFENAFHPSSTSCVSLTATQDKKRATVSCNVPNGPKIGEGPLDGPYSTVPSLDVVAPAKLDLPRLAPEGDELFTRDWNTGTTTSTLHVFTRTADSYVSKHVVTMPFALDSFAQFGTPTRGPMRRMFVKPVPAMTGFSEVSIEGGAATVVRSYTPASVGLVDVYSQPNLTPDGLRAVLQGRSDPNLPAALFYIDRLDLDAPWNAPTQIVQQAGGSEVFMTADCGRVYFIAGGVQVYSDAE